jgi:hypothetical protein
MLRPVTGLLVLVLFLLAVGFVTGAEAQPASPTHAAEAAADSTLDGSWLTRTLKRYFGNSGQAGDELNGRAVELVDGYEAYIGKTIEVVIVHQVARFDPNWHHDQASSQKILNSATKPFQSYTKDRLIREYLLFEAGQPLDPFLLADSERMLRELDFINDVRINLVPLMGEKDDSVVVIVETRDKWPFGITGDLKDVNRYDLNLYFSNIGGYGVRLDNKLKYRGDMEPNAGYQGRLRKENIRGSFINMFLLYEDSWQVLSRMAALQRELIHPGIRWVGGGSWEYTDLRDNGGIPRKYQLGDYWVGHAIPLNKKRSTEQSARPMLIPAVRYRKIDYLEAPYASADTNTAYLDTRDYLGGVTYQRFKNFKTSYLFKMGETEDFPSGFTAKLSGGYQDRQVYDRVSGFLQAAYVKVRPHGSITMAGVDLGGYFHKNRIEDGSLNVIGAHYTRLMGGGRFRHRIYARAGYTLAFQRNGGEALVLGNITGLRGLDDNKILGNQRLVINLESRVFTPWSVMGFRFMLFGYADVGAVGGERDPIVQKKIYSSLGLGFRINNPDLVLPSTQVRFGFVNSIEENGFVLGFKLGGVDYPEIRMPGTLPGGFAFR